MLPRLPVHCMDKVGIPAGPQQQFCWVACCSSDVCMLQVLREMAAAAVQPLSTLREAHLPTGAQLSGAGTQAEAPQTAALAPGQWVGVGAHQEDAVGSQEHQQGSHRLGQGLETDQQEVADRQQSPYGWLPASTSSQTVSGEGLESEATGQGPHRSMPSTISSSSASSMPPAAAVGLPVMSLPGGTPMAPPSQASQGSTSRAKPEWGAHPAAMADQARAAGDIFGLGDRHRTSPDRWADWGGQARRPQSLDLREKQRQAGGNAGLYRWAVSCLPHAHQHCHLQAAR